MRSDRRAFVWLVRPGMLFYAMARVALSEARAT